MNTIMKRIVSLVLCFVLVAGYLPIGALATGTGEPVATEATEVTTEPTQAASEETEVIPVSGITLDQTAVEVGVGELPMTLTATVLPEDATDKTVIWTSTEPGVVSVDENGILTFGYMGEATITATAGEFSASCVVTVGEGEWSDFAAGETTYVLAGSDFQADSGDAVGSANINNIISVIKDAGYSTMDGFLFAGDYSVGATKSSNVAALKNTIKAAYPELTDEQMVLIQGNHDNSASYTGAEAGLVGSVLNESGENDAENYGVYVINEKDYNWRGKNENLVKQTAADLDDYLDAKRNAEYTQPIFVVSHLPLNYNMRTKNDGDGMYANYIFDVLNEAGEAGLNIIFMFGHDHSNGWDDYLGGAAIYLEKGDKINIAQGSQTDFAEETLAFTYMNAGYVGYYRNVNTGSETDLTMTVFKITDDKVEINRFSQTAVHDLKSVGVTNSYRNESGYSRNTAVYESPQTVTLNKTITPAGEEIEVPDSGNTGSGNTGTESTERTYTRVTSTSELVSGGKYLLIYNGSHFMLPEVVEKSSSSTRKGFNIESTSICGPNTITGDYEAKEWVLTSSGNGWLLGNGTQYAKLTDTTNYKITATLENSGDVFTIGGSENAFTFSNGTYVLNYNSRGLINGYGSDAAPFYIYRMTSAGSSGSGAGTSGGEWVTITAPTEGGTRYQYQLDTNGVDQNVEYLIVANSYAKALSAAASSDNAVDITLDGEYAYATSDTYGWTFTRYSNGVYYIRLNGNTYLALSGNGLSSSNNSGSSRRWTVTSNRDGSYDIVRNEYNLRWSNSNGVFQASKSNEGPVRLYKYVKSETTQGLPGLYGKIDGELTYTVENGTSQEDALQAVKAGITGYTSANANGSNSVALDDSALTWNFEDGYSPVQGGEYPVSITYNGVELGTAKVVVKTVAISGYSLYPNEGTVEKGVPQSANTGATLTVTLENGKFYTVPVTVAMLSKADGSAVSTGVAGIQENLRVTYNGEVVEGYFTLHVTARTGNNYPEYPHEGSVKVNKTGTGIDFQSSGIAQVEISASGVPMKKGADVIVMLDLSSSMDTNKVTVNGVEKSRLQVLRESMTVLLKQLQANDSDGNPMDIRIAVADFNRYYTDSSSPYYINSADHPTGGSIRTNDDGTNKVYTGGRGLNANAFVDVHEITNNAFETTSETNQYYLGYASGTNYDYAFDAIYQLGEAINTKNAAEGTERDLFVIFMSDGAPFQYNYFSSKSDGNGAAYWNNWLQGSMTDAMFADGSNKSYYNAAGKHWMAEAIKGVRGTAYPVIRKNNAADTDNDNWVTVNGLGAKMYSIGFCLAKDKEITVASMDTVIRKLASEEQYYYPANSAEDLNSAFAAIGSDISYAAYKARFVDQMGDNYNIQLETKTYTVINTDNTTTQKKLEPVVEILSYAIYTVDDQEADAIPEGKNVGDRKGTKTLQEVVKFSADGKKAYSNLIDVDKDGTYGVTVSANGTYTISDTDDNILGTDGIIYAMNFLYNTNATDVAVNGVAIPTGKDSANLTTGSTNVLPSETFYWKMGTVQTSELAMRYYVYLEGSMEGTRPAGSYPTNNFATLYYDNYLNNPCYKETISPMLAWKSANVSYAFYLVNEDGKVIVNQTTGETGAFAQKIAITRPVVFDENLFLNETGTTVTLKEVIASNVLPDYYTPYDMGAKYQVQANSNGGGWWKIESGFADGPYTTYVTGFDVENADAYSIEKSMTNGKVDYTHTTVWFAVKLVAQAHPDTVVVDYGLPVDISVLSNDMFGENGKLAAVGPYTSELNLNGHSTALAEGFDSDFDADDGAKYGTATADTATGKVRYALNSMKMDSYEQFAYAVNYIGNENAGYYYDTVTVIPATTIYYEDSFVSFNDLDWKQAAGGRYWEGYWEEAVNTRWSQDGTEIDGVQGEDRPGQYSVTDANNIYGFDGVNKSMSTYSMGSAMKATVEYNKGAQASFTFTGTGFDVISMTNSTTGTILVKVYNAEGEEVKNLAVDTYYGYTQADCHVVYVYKDANKQVDKNGDGNKENDFEWVLSNVLHKSTECTEKCTKVNALPAMVDDNVIYHQADYHVEYIYKDVDTDVDKDNDGDFANDYEWVADIKHPQNKCTETCTVVEQLPENPEADTIVGMISACHEDVYVWKNGKWQSNSTPHVAAGCMKESQLLKEASLAENAWIESASAASIWQVPVMKVEGLPYGRYTAKIQAVYDSAFDHVEGSETGNYDFYLDAIRIYDPANDGAADNKLYNVTYTYTDGKWVREIGTAAAENAVERKPVFPENPAPNDTVTAIENIETTIEDAYVLDGEGWPSYMELRNGLINEGSLGNDDTDIVVKGLVFIDGDESVGDAQLEDYVSYGPNNEVYLAKYQRVAFKLDLPENIAKVHIGIKSADGKPGTYTITNISGSIDEETGKTIGKFFNAKTFSMDTSTDMYYDLTDWKNDIIVISNTGDRYNTDGIISLTNIKFTYTSAPGNNEASIFVTPKMTKLLLRVLNAPAEEIVPEETLPEESVPETTSPDETEETIPEVTEPEETEPEITVPEKPKNPQKQIEQAVKEVVTTVVNTVVNVLKNLFGKWFR